MPKEPPVTETQSLGQAEVGLGRLRAAAQRERTLRFNNLMHHIGIDLRRKAYLALNRKAARGVDGLSWKDYSEGLEARLVDLQCLSGEHV